MASKELLLISRSSTFRSRLAFAASSFMCSNILWPAGPNFVGLTPFGEGKPDKGVMASAGTDATLSGSEPVLTTRFWLCSGLGVI